MARSSLRQFKVQCSKVQCELPPCCALTQTESQFQSLQLFNRSAPRNAAARSSRSTALLRSRRIRLTSVPRVPKFQLLQSSRYSPTTKIRERLRTWPGPHIARGTNSKNESDGIKWRCSDCG